MARWMIGNRDLQEFSDCTFFYFCSIWGELNFGNHPQGRLYVFSILLNLFLFILIVKGELNFGNHPGKIVCFFYVCSI